MSGVNRNVLKNTGIPVMAQDQIPMELVSNTGTRFVLLNWPVKTYLTSSQGGDCEGITVQWTTDSSLASEPDNAYPNLTSSVLSCNSSSQVPLTSSALWSVFINSSYNFTGSNSDTKYYLRSFQNVSGGGRGPYSNVVSLETRAPKVYNGDMQTQGFRYAGAVGKPGITGSVVILSPDSFNPNTGQLQVWAGDNLNVYATGSTISGSLQPIKVGGPNYDAIQTNGATIRLALTGSPSGASAEPNTFMDTEEVAQIIRWSGSNVNDINICNNGAPYMPQLGESGEKFFSWTAAVGIVSGSLEISGSGGYYLFVSATTSSSATSVSTLSGSADTFPTGTNTTNSVIATRRGQILCTMGNPGFSTKFRWYINSGDVPGTGSAVISNPSNALGNEITIRTSADCVFRTISLGVTYNYELFRQQFGV
jgi:hypothetical protein